MKQWECFECVTCTMDSQNRCRNTNNSIQKQKERVKTSKPTTGDLLVDGMVEVANQTFALLNFKKMELIKQGIQASRIKITYTKAVIK